MSIIPCGHRIIVKLVALEDIDPVYKRAQESGIFIAQTPDHIREQQAVDKGIVVAIGPTAFKIYSDEDWCAIGDMVAFAKYSGKGVQDVETGESFLVLNDEDIVVILKKGNTDGN